MLLHQAGIIRHLPHPKMIEGWTFRGGCLNNVMLLNGDTWPGNRNRELRHPLPHGACVVVADRLTQTALIIAPPQNCTGAADTHIAVACSV